MAHERTRMRAYSEGFRSAGEAAIGAVGAVERDLRIGRTVVRMRLAGPALMPLAHALRHVLHAPGLEPPVATIVLWDAASTGVLPPPFPVDDLDLPASGVIRPDPESDTIVVVQGPVRRRDGAYEAMTVLDGSSATAWCFTTTVDRIPALERAAPLRAVLQWALNGTDRMLAHASAIGSLGRGALLAGCGGSGKSTVAVAGMLAGMSYLADDYVFVDLATPTPTAHSLYASAKLPPEALPLLFTAPDARALAASDPGADKYVLDVDSICPGALVSELRLGAIVLPTVAPGEGTRLEPASAGAALLALAPTSVLHPPQRDAGELGPLAELARRLPAYRLVLDDDPEAAAALVRALLEQA